MIAATHPLFETPLPRDWKVLTVDDIKSPEKSSCVAGPFGSNISSKYFVEEGVPVIRGSNLRDDLTRFVPHGFVFVSKQQAERYKAQHVRSDDLVFTCWGTLGQVGLIPRDGPFPEYIISNKQLKLRPNFEISDPLYLFYYFAGPKMIEHILNRAIGAAVPGINLGILKGLPVVLPPLTVQRRIASILGAYDELIDVNLRRIALLEEMARRLFEEWFVRFRFPGHEGHAMVETADGPKPEGWPLSRIGDLTAYLSRGIAPKYDATAASLVISQKCIRNQRLSLAPARTQSKPIPREKLVQSGDVLINSTGVGTLGRVAQAEVVPADLTVDSHVTIVRPDIRLDRDFFGLALLRMEALFERLGVGATGQTELNRNRIADLTLAEPPLRLQRVFGHHARPIRALAFQLARQNDLLAATRDLLLPRLISGEISVPTAERELDAVA